MSNKCNIYVESVNPVPLKHYAYSTFESDSVETKTIRMKNALVYKVSDMIEEIETQYYNVLTHMTKQKKTIAEIKEFVDVLIKYWLDKYHISDDINQFVDLVFFDEENESDNKKNYKFEFAFIGLLSKEDLLSYTNFEERDYLMSRQDWFNFKHKRIIS